jgi:Xaa-Pro dipeptidase
MSRMVEQGIVSAEALRAEAEEKQARLERLFDENDISAVLLRRSENIAWATCGQVEARVLIPSETWVTSVLHTRDGRKFYFAPKNEAPRLSAEEFEGLGYEPVLYPWYENNCVAAAQKIAGGVEIGCDIAEPGFVTVKMAPLRR